MFRIRPIFLVAFVLVAGLFSLAQSPSQSASSAAPMSNHSRDDGDAMLLASRRVSLRNWKPMPAGLQR
jgi:hypothetical protein